MAALIGVAAPAGAQPVPIELIVASGDPPPGETEPITSLRTAFANGVGELGFVGAVLRPSGPDAFVWYDDGPIWYDSDALPEHVLGMSTGHMGISDSGEFIYDVRVDARSGVWTNNGLLLAHHDPVPGHPGLFSTSNTRPQMLPDGTAYWLGGFTDTPHTPTQGSALFRSTDTATPVIEMVIQTGEVVDGYPILGLKEFVISDNGEHHIQLLNVDNDTGFLAGSVYVDGSIVALWGDPAVYAVPPAVPANWGNFHTGVVTVNSAGDYLFSDRTDGPDETNNFLAYNGVIHVREGDVLDGLTLADPSNCHSMSINDLGQAVFVWSIAGLPVAPVHHLFFAPDAANLQGAIRLLSPGDLVDVDGDGVADYEVLTIPASPITQPGLDLAEGFLYLRLGLKAIDQGHSFGAIARLSLEIPNVVVTPSLHDYGPVPPGETAVQEFTIANGGVVDLEISGTQITGPDAAEFSIVSGGGPTTLAPGEQVVVEIAFTPSSGGPSNAFFEIASNDPNSSVLAVTLAGGGGTGLLEIPTLSPLGLAALAALLLGLGVAVLRRRTA